jgi:hypothetical protein
LPNQLQRNNPLSRKFIESLKELDQIEDPALRALARRAIAKYYGVRSFTPGLIICSWAVLILALVGGLYWLGIWKTFMLEIGLFVVCSAAIGFSLMHEGQLSERGFMGFWKLCLNAMFKWPRAILEIYKKKNE